MLRAMSLEFFKTSSAIAPTKILCTSTQLKVATKARLHVLEKVLSKDTPRWTDVGSTSLSIMSATFQLHGRLVSSPLGRLSAMVRSFTKVMVT